MWQSVFSLLIAVLVVGRYCLSDAHEVSTHENITHRAIEYLVQQDPTLAGIQDIADKIIFGSKDEDSGNRFFFHFLPTLPNLASCDSLEWGFLDELCTAQVFGIEFIQRNTHKWQDAVSQASNGKGFDHLGYILHLLEDLTSPAHTRKDAHPPGDSDPFEKYNEGRCSAVGECIPQDDLINLALDTHPQKPFIDLRDFTATNFFSEDTIKADIYTQNPPCDFLGGDPQPCGPTAVREDNDYFYDQKDRRIAYKGRFRPKINERVAREQFDELAPEAVRYVASLIKFYIERANPPLPPAIIRLNANPSLVLINDQSVISVEAVDPNGDPLTYAWAATCGSLSGFTGPEDKTFTAPDTPGTCTVNVTVTDPAGASDMASVEIEVSEVPLDCSEDIDGPTILSSNFINGGAIFTSSPTVTLNLAANDACGVARYQISHFVADKRKNLVPIISGGYVLSTEDYIKLLCAMSAPDPTKWIDIVPATETYSTDLSYTPALGFGGISDGQFLGICVAFQDTRGNISGVADAIIFSETKPFIVNFNATPPFVFVNDQSTIAVEALDPNGDFLAYTWSTTCGNLSGATGPEDKIWTAPPFAGFCTINVSATDPFGESDSESVEIGIMPVGCSFEEDIGPIVLNSNFINNGAVSTSSTTVTLNLNTQDQCGVARYQFLSFARDDDLGPLLCSMSGPRGDAWKTISPATETYISDIPYTFPPFLGIHDGTKVTVCIFLQNTRGFVSNTDDTIIFSDS